ncbi:hypothetical protein [Nocardia cyriacigeorgica]|nr:hypothetical protein [Nocardia cyriacigeorgica]
MTGLDPRAAAAVDRTRAEAERCAGLRWNGGVARRLNAERDEVMG